MNREKRLEWLSQYRDFLTAKGEEDYQRLLKEEARDKHLSDVAFVNQNGRGK